MKLSEEAIRSVISAETGLDETVLKPDATLEELDVSSLDLVSALFALEDQFGIVIEPETIESKWTISELIDHALGLSPN